MTRRPYRLSAALLLTTVLCGLAVRFASLGLPHYVAKYGGSALWALAMYWLVSTLCGSRPPVISVLLSAALATAVEFFKLYHSPAMDAFRLTLPGVLLLGRIFSLWDIVAYITAISLGGLLDYHARRALAGRR